MNAEENDQSDYDSGSGKLFETIDEHTVHKMVLVKDTFHWVNVKPKDSK